MRSPGRLRLAVGLVGDEVDVGALAVVGGCERGGEVAEVLLGVNGADGVVRRVDDDGLRALGDCSGNGIDVNLEGLGIGHDLDAGRAGGLDPHAVLGEVRRDYDDLVARVHRRVEADGERCRGAAGQIDVTGAIRRTKAAVEAGGHGLAGGRKARRRRVAVQLRGRQLQRPGNGGPNGLGRRN